MKTLKKIHLKGVSEILSEKELKNVLGGKRDTVCKCTFFAPFCEGEGGYQANGALFGGGNDDDCYTILQSWARLVSHTYCYDPDGTECYQIDY